MNYPMTKKVNVTGDNTRMYWTFRALARMGISVEPDAAVQIYTDEKGWRMNEINYASIEELLQALDSIPAS
jgi:hypothetical protein